MKFFIILAYNSEILSKFVVENIKNALLSLSEEEQIHEIKYLPTELVLQLEGDKNTIVDVLCTDVRGRKFCVEMQMEWSE